MPPNRPSPRFARCLAAFLSLATALPSVSHAGPTQEAELEALRKRFREGITLENQNKWEDAHAVFEDIAQKKMTPHVRFHLALCDSNLGRLRSAKTGFAEALEMAKQEPSAAQEVIDNAPLRLAELDERIPRLVLVVSGGGEAEVLLDEEALGVVKKRREIVLDPGSHTLAVKVDSGKKPLRTFSIAERERMEITVPGPDDGKTEDVPEIKDPIVKDTPEPTGTKGTKVPFFVVGSVGLASLVASGVMIGLRQLAISEVRDSCSGEDTGCDPGVEEVAARGQRYEIAAWALGATGFACLGAATALFFTIGQDKPPPKKGTTFQLSPSLGGLAVRGTFE